MYLFNVHLGSPNNHSEFIPVSFASLIIALYTLLYMYSKKQFTFCIHRAKSLNLSIKVEPLIHPSSLSYHLKFICIQNCFCRQSAPRNIEPKHIVKGSRQRGSGMCQTVPICLGPRRLMLFSLLILLSSLILCISVSAPVKQNQ